MTKKIRSQVWLKGVQGGMIFTLVDDDVYYYIGERLKLERETENVCV